MRLTALAVAILALGIVAGFALAGGASERSVSAVPQCPGPSAQCATATPAPPQAREDQITIFTGTPQLSVGFGGTVFRDIVFAPSLGLDNADYPPNTSFRFEAAIRNSGSTPICMRLFDMTGSAAVPGSEVCLSTETGTQFRPYDRVRSDPIQLLDGERQYIAQLLCPAGCSEKNYLAARVIAEWTE